jgi:dTDP-4-amino-4,6-dideoxygalactose transaminase
MSRKRIYMSPPHMCGEELKNVMAVFEANWIAPAGPDITAFENEFCQITGAKHAAALSSGTAALHLALLQAGVEQGDEVICSSFTFAASANAIKYCGGVPVFIDSDMDSWNMDPALLEEVLARKKKAAKLPKAVVLVHINGNCADISSIKAVCEKYQVMLIEDAAEVLGATYKGKSPGTFAKIGIFSFNGNKIITTSGGGMLVSDDPKLVDKVRYLSQQARQPAVHYEHTDIGYNYRLSNVLAAIGRGQLTVLKERVEKKRYIFKKYYDALNDFPGITFMPETKDCYSTRWLTSLIIDPVKSGTSRNNIIEALENENVESRPLWKPMHMQPVFHGCEYSGGNVSELLFEQGLCLPSGTALTDSDLDMIIATIKECFHV